MVEAGTAMQQKQRWLLPHARPLRHQARALHVKKEPYAVYQHAHEVIFRAGPLQSLLSDLGQSDDLRLPSARACVAAASCTSVAGCRPWINRPTAKSATAADTWW